MKNLAAYMVAAGCLLGGVPSFAATPEVEPVGTCTEIAWRRLFERFWSPKRAVC